MSVRWFFRYVFYRLYQWNMTGRWKDSVFASSQAMSAVGAILIANIYSVLVLIDLIAGKSFFDDYIDQLDTLTFVVGILLLLAIFRLVIFTEGGERIIEKFKKINETQEQREKRTIYAWVYGIGSATLLFLAIFLPPLIRS